MRFCTEFLHFCEKFKISGAAEKYPRTSHRTRTPSLHRSNQSLITSMGAWCGATPKIAIFRGAVRDTCWCGRCWCGAWLVCVRAGVCFFGRTGYFEFLPKMQEFGAKPHYVFHIINKIAFKRSE